MQILSHEFHRNLQGGFDSQHHFVAEGVCVKDPGAAGFWSPPAASTDLAVEGASPAATPTPPAAPERRARPLPPPPAPTPTPTPTPTPPAAPRAPGACPVRLLVAGLVRLLTAPCSSAGASPPLSRRRRWRAASSVSENFHLGYSLKGRLERERAAGHQFAGRTGGLTQTLCALCTSAPPILGSELTPAAQRSSSPALALPAL